MADLSTTYLGLKLRNPIIVGSSGLTNSINKIKDLEAQGAGAVVLKSLFEEEIAREFEQVMREIVTRGYKADEYEYYDQQIRSDRLAAHTEFIAQAKKAVSIPVIASVNCMYAHEWTAFARELQAAGADALELNMFFLPSDLNRSGAEHEQLYFDLVKKIKAQVSIPVALKIGYHFSNLALMIRQLCETGIDGLVLFNRFYTPDFDIDHFKVVSRNVLSTPAELGLSLRWVAMMSGRVRCDLCASTGVHDGTAVIKQLLAGAKAVQVVSVLYQNGTKYIGTMLNELDAWMTRNGFFGLEQFVGKMSQAASENPAALERTQFMKYAGGQE